MHLTNCLTMHINDPQSPDVKRKPSQVKAFTILSLMLFASIAAVVLKPAVQKEQIELETSIPKQFGEWKAVPSNLVQMSLSIKREGEANTINPYDSILMRIYENSEGKQMMLALAWGRAQRQEVKVHRPEKCYTAQGFEVQNLEPVVFTDIKMTSKPVVGKRMLALGNHRNEAVSYWIRLGDSFPSTGLETRMKILKDGLKGKLNDGILVRVSTVINQVSGATAAYGEQEKFLAELVNSVGMAMPNLLVPVSNHNQNS